MTSGVPWHMRGVRPEVIDSAREAARRSGMSVEEWLDTVIAQSARHAGIEPDVHQLSDFDRRPYRESPDTRSWRQDEPARRDSSFSEVSARLDELARQVDHLSSTSASRTPGRQPAMGSDDSGAIADVLARLDRKIDRLGAMGSAAPLGYAPPTAPRPAPAAAGSEVSVDQALAEIEAAQRMLDGGGATAPMELPRAPTQQLPDLEQQLRQINARIDTMRPCGIDAAVETLARRPRRNRHDAQGSDAAAGDRGPGSRGPLAGVAHRRRTPCRRRWRHDGERRARPRRSPRRAARADPC